MATVTKPIALDESLNTTEQTPRNVADVLAQELSAVATAIGGISAPSAEDVSYDNTDSGLTADNVQDAIDEVKSDIPTVNDGTLTIQQNGETKGTFTANQSGNSTVNIETPTTDIQTAVDEFETYNGGLLSECKVSLSPNQDLHGYPNPWVGGAGKNKLPNNITTATAYGVTYVTQEDGSIEGNGTATDWANAVLVSDLLLKAGTYILSGTTVEGAYITVVPLPDTGVSYSAVGVNGTKEITFDNDTHVLVRVSARQGTVLSNAKYYPMLRLASVTDASFEPYENKCPISGHTQVEVDVSDGQATQEQVTVNLGGTYYSGTLDVVSGELTVDSAFIASYNGETLPSTWISDRDVYAVGTTPTTGAEVCYKLATPQTIQLSPTTVKALVGENHLSAPLDGQDIVESKYKQMFTFDDVIAYIQSLS